LKFNNKNIKNRVVKNIFYTIFLLSISFFIYSSCSFTQKTCLKKLNEAQSYKYDVIIVPGIPYEKPVLNNVLEQRIIWSKYLFDKNITKNIIYSGNATYNPFYESKIMALYANKLGISDSNVFTELNARHSTENAYYSYKIAKELGFEKIAIATDPFQCKLLKKFASKRMDKSVGLIPFYYDSLKTVNINLNDFSIIDSIALKANFSDIKNESMIKRFKGTLGLDIKYY
tara:strand:- start:806 stop:1492 length:687 start_codon:yes stop_codon:yes gene_type:complete